ncbi:MAG: formylglycine-generating enzyme family protein [Cyanobacteria bacterium RM1_2_2]|nr:formylglycine-generating enzyme family protein [Cyanobacteria bacterium RM1_2_2]
MPQHASLSDIATLKNDAYRAQVEQDWEQAERLWIRVLAAASGQDTDAIKALQMIAVKRNAGTIPEPAQPPKPPEAPLPEPKKDSEKVATPPVVSPQPAQSSPVSSPLPISTQTPVQQYFNRSRVARSARRIPLIDQPLASQQWTRQKFLKWAGLGSAGLVTAVVGREVFKGSPLSEPQPPKDSFSVAVAEPKYTQLTEEVAEGLPLWRVDFETVTVDARGQVTERFAKQANFFKKNLGNGVILEMGKIPAGSFSMGSPDTEKERDADESPQHTVNVSSFFIGKFAVTQAQYQQLMGNNPASFKGENHPVEGVSWHDAAEFCTKLSRQTGRTYRLPSEAEWEYACRAGTTTPFYFGETITSALANYNASYIYQSEPKGEYRQQTTEVGKFSPNAFGLYDMHGNVWEWCQDHWHNNYQGAPNDGRAWLSEDKEAPRLLRGGSWFFNPRDCRSATRVSNVAGFRNLTCGFRVVCVASRTL